jgi:predicted nucleic acid-binding protein
VIAYFDTSAIIPLLVDDEPGAEAVLAVWLSAESVVTVRILFAEAAAALARAARLGRLEPEALDLALGELDSVWSQLDIVDIDDSLVRTAGSLARTHPLRGYDAVHCAAALRLADPTTVALAGDQQLLAAWRTEGLQVVDTRA